LAQGDAGTCWGRLSDRLEGNPRQLERLIADANRDDLDGVLLRSLKLGNVLLVRSEGAR
jgi:hypothetical protein